MALFFKPNIQKLLRKKKSRKLAKVLLRYRDDEIRNEAAKALVELKDPESAPLLNDLFDKAKNREEKNTVLRVLLEMGAENADALFQSEVEKNAPEERPDIYSCAENLPDITAIRLLSPWLKKDTKNYPLIARILLNLGDASAVDPLLTNGPPKRCAVLARLIAAMGEPGAALLARRVRELPAEKRDPEQAKVHAGQLIPFLAPCLFTFSSSMRVPLLLFLLSLGKKSGTLAIDHFFFKSFTGGAVDVLHALANQKRLPSRSVAWVKKGLSSESEEIRIAAIGAARVFPPGYFNKLLIKILKGADKGSSSWTTRCSPSKSNLKIIEALCFFPDAGALEVLGDILDAYSEYSPNNKALGQHMLSLLPKSQPCVSELLLNKMDSPHDTLRIPAREMAIVKDPKRIVPILVKDLSRADENRRNEAIRFLEEMKWRPETDREKSWWAAAHKKWDDVASFGKTAIPVFEWMLENGILLEQTSGALHRLNHVPDRPDLAVVFHIACRDRNALVRMGSEIFPHIMNAVERFSNQLRNSALETAISAIECFNSLEPESLDRMVRFLENTIRKNDNLRPSSDLVCRTFDIFIRNDENKSAETLSQWLRREIDQGHRTSFRNRPLTDNANVLEHILMSPFWKGETLIPILFDMFADTELRKSAVLVLLSLATDHSDSLFRRLLDDLDSGNHELRKSRAELLRDLSASGFFNPSQWKLLEEIREKISVNHKDFGTDRAHRDCREKDGWCIYHTDEAGSSHTDKGIGVMLPKESPALRLYGLAIKNGPSVQSWGMDPGLPIDDLVHAMSDASAKSDNVLSEAMRSRDWRRRAVAAQALAHYHGKHPRMNLLNLLEDKYAPVRLEAIRTVSRLQIREALPILKICLDDPNARVVEASARAMQSMGWKPESGEDIDYWARALESPDPLRRIEAIRKLATFNTPVSKKAIFAMLDDQEESVRRTAARQLADTGWEPDRGSPEHALFLADTQQWGRLRGLEENGEQLFSETLSNPPEDLDLTGFIAALVKLPSRKGERMLAEKIESGRDREFAAKLLETWNEHEVPPKGTLETFLGHKDVAIRSAAAAIAFANIQKYGEELLSRFFHRENEPGVIVSMLETMAEKRTICCSLDLLEIAGVCDALDHILRDTPKDRDSRLATFRRQVDIGRYPAVIGPQAKAFVFKSDETRATLAGLLNSIRHVFLKGEQGNKILTDALQTNDTDVFPFKKGALSIIQGMPDGPVLADLLQSVLIHITYLADTVFEKVDKGTASCACDAVLSSPDAKPDARQKAAAILKRIGRFPQNRIATIHYHLARKEWGRAAKFGEEAIDPMVAVLTGGENFDRDALVQIAGNLASVDHPRTFESLKQMLLNYRPGTSQAVARTMPRFGEKALEPLLTALRTGLGTHRRNADPEIANAIRIIVSRHPALLNDIRKLQSGDMKHQDTAAVAHRDKRIPLPGHKDVGGGSCLYHGDTGKRHEDTPGVSHRDFGFPFDFRL